MAIDGIGSIGGVTPPDDRRVKEDVRSDSPQKAPETGRPSDSVELSRGDIANLRKQLDLIPEVRSERIEELRRAIENGSYDAPAEKVADSLLEELF